MFLSKIRNNAFAAPLLANFIQKRPIMSVQVVTCISPKEAEEFALDVLKLHKYWATHDTYFHTLGAVTYLEAFNANGPLEPEKLGGYYSHKEKMNPVLNERFSGLYKRIVATLSEKIGPAALIDELGFPGFHIFGATPDKGFIDQDFIDNFNGESWGNLHIDIQYIPHLPVLKKYKKINLEKTLSFTLALRLPKNGSGLRIWRNIEGRENIERFNYLDLEDRIEVIGTPNEIIYETGNLTFFTGHLVHQVPSTKGLLSDDLRITLQGHGVCCDGVWRLYF